jgi:transcriptional regulator of heat shock response
MEQRLLELLRLVVEDYVATGEPVGSQRLVEECRLDVSPATVRNWFTELEELGCLMQPHTSGGRIPTEKGFQAYVEAFIQLKPAAKRDHEVLAQALQAPAPESARVKALAKLLADRSGQAVVVGLERADTFYTGLSQLFSQPEFKQWQRVVTLTEILDHLDEVLGGLRRSSYEQPSILLGRACPFGAICGSTVISLSDRAFIGILGPLRMDYQHATSLLLSSKQLFSQT